LPGLTGKLDRDRHALFAEAQRREASHAGMAYPEEPEALRATLGYAFK